MKTTKQQVRIFESSGTGLLQEKVNTALTELAVDGAVIIDVTYAPTPCTHGEYADVITTSYTAMVRFIAGEEYR